MAVRDTKRPSLHGIPERGLEFLHADVESGAIELAFATEDFTNPTGNVLGAFGAAMLYDTLGRHSWPPLSLTSSSPPWSFTSSSFARCGLAGSSARAASSAAEEAKRVFEALPDGGEVTLPIGETFWSPMFGMCVDRFGTPWMVGAEAPA